MPHIEPTHDQIKAFLSRNITGKVVMLNLLRYRDTADYSAHPELAPPAPISGAQAYKLYAKHALPHIEASGGKVTFIGHGGPAIIGPTDERWDVAMLVEHTNPQAFLGFATNTDYLAGLGHRTAALADSRLIPLSQVSGF